MAWSKILLDGDIEATDPLVLAGDVTIVGGGKSLEVLNLKAETAAGLVIGTGDITVTQMYHYVDTEADAGSDFLDGIIGGNDGQMLILRPELETQTVVIQHNQNAAATKNILLGNGNDFTMDNLTDMILLMYDSTVDSNGAWIEIARNVGAPAVLSSSVPNTIEPDDTASAGSAPDASRQDHEHAIVAAVPSSIGTALSEGNATSFTRSNHIHDLGADCVDSGDLIADAVINTEHLVADSVGAAAIDDVATDIAFNQLILTPKATGDGTTEGTVFYDSDDDHLYVYVV